MLSYASPHQRSSFQDAAGAVDTEAASAEQKNSLCGEVYKGSMTPRLAGNSSSRVAQDNSTSVAHCVTYLSNNTVQRRSYTAAASAGIGTSESVDAYSGSGQAAVLHPTTTTYSYPVMNVAPYDSYAGTGFSTGEAIEASSKNAVVGHATQSSATTGLSAMYASSQYQSYPLSAGITQQQQQQPTVTIAHAASSHCNGQTFGYSAPQSFAYSDAVGPATPSYGTNNIATPSYATPSYSQNDVPIGTVEVGSRGCQTMSTTGSLSGYDYAIQSAINQGRIYSPSGGVYVPGSLSLKSGMETLYDSKIVPTFELPLSFQNSISKTGVPRGITENTNNKSNKTNRSNFVVAQQKRKACC